jgi:glutaredoxin 3
MSRPKVTMYSSPFCGYCAAAKRLLDKKGVAYDEIDVVFDPDRRKEMVELSGRTTVPQIFIGETHVGGFDDLSALESRGELDALLGAGGPGDGSTDNGSTDSGGSDNGGPDDDDDNGVSVRASDTAPED